jgi:NADPH-dependent 2,4-dienoyl-CoA reductase/sulfur reductase-like enzyme
VSSSPASPYRPEFEAALRLFARVSTAMDAAGFRLPVLVGGAAVEIYTRGAVTTGDFDFACGRQDIFEDFLQLHGFARPNSKGATTRGWVHSELKLGFEVVTDVLLDGLADREMVQVVQLGSDGNIAVIAPEDMIADRMGQYASGSAPEMLGQARALFALCEALDMDYMKRRIAEETVGEYGVQDLQAKA